MKPEELIQLKRDVEQIKRQLGGLSNDPRQVQVIKTALKNEGLVVKSLDVTDNFDLGGNLTVTGDFQHNGTNLGFYGGGNIAQQSSATSPTGGGTIDSEARSSIDELITILDNLGLTA